MKTINHTEYNNMPESQKRFWSVRYLFEEIYCYNQVMVPLEEVEAIIQGIEPEYPISQQTKDSYLTKLREIAK